MRSDFLTSLEATLPVLEEYKTVSLGEDDILIHAPGFEPRTLDIIDAVAPHSKSRAILLEFEPYVEENQLKQVREGLSNRGTLISDSDVVKYHRFEPSDFEERLFHRLRSLSAKTVFVDITTMSKLEIMLVLNVCLRFGANVNILYSEAENYGPSEEEFEAAQQENEIHRPSLQVYTGVRGVVRVDSLASVAMQGHPTAALVFMSFNDALTQSLLNTVYPSRLFLINSHPPVLKWREAATAWIHEQVQREWEEDNPLSKVSGSEVPLPTRSVSTLDYRETVSLLLRLYWRLSNSHRVLLAPAGSKWQAVGCFLLKALHPDVQVEYPTPEGFSRYYSSGVGSRWQLKLGPLQESIRNIADKERKEFLKIPT